MKEGLHVSGDRATLEVWRRHADPDQKDETVAVFELQHLPETNEVVLLRSGETGEAEAVYSEIVQ